MAGVAPGPRDLDYHVLPPEHFEALAAGEGDVDTVGLLWRAERSRRLILVRSILDLLESDDSLRGPLPAADEAWRTLREAQEKSPAAFDEVLLHPQLGSWLAYALRRHRGGAQSDAPLWIDLGSVHALALVAAAACGVPCETRVPLRAGRITLPRLGAAHFPDAPPWTFAEAHVDARTGQGVRLRHGDTAMVVRADARATAEGWWDLRRVSVGDGPTLRVWIDDLDPFRDLADPVPPARLSDEDLRTWRSLLAQAWEIICAQDPGGARAMAAGVVSIVPLPRGDGWGTRSASTGDAFGSVMVSPPSDAVTLAVSLVHEFMHIKLGGLIHLVHLVEDRPAARLYAPWRDDPRPLGGLLQGVYAFFGIAGFWREYGLRARGESARLAQFEYVYARQQTREGLATVAGCGALTNIGQRFVDGIASRLESWLDDDVPADIAALAKTVADSHRAGWRIRNLRLDPEEVRLLVNAWMAGERAVPATASPMPVAGPDLRWSQPRLGLARRSILDRQRPPDSHSGPAWLAGLTDADYALMAGDAEAARAGFERQIAVDPDNLDAWAGLCASVVATAPPRVAAALVKQPEVVRALHAEAASAGKPATVHAVAHWIGG